MITASCLWRLAMEKPGALMVVDHRLSPDLTCDPPRKARRAIVTGSGFVVLVSPAMGRLFRLRPDSNHSIGHLAGRREYAELMRSIPLIYRKRAASDLSEAFEIE